MALKSYKPTTPGQRGLVLIDRSELWKGRPVKSLTEGLTGKGGRNNTGRITMRRRGGGVKRLYRIVDFKRAQARRAGEGDPDRVRPEPDRVHRADRLCRRRAGLHPGAAAAGGRRHGDRGAKADIKPGNAMPFTAMPIGTIVHNVEMKPGKGGQIARSAGTYAQFVGRDGGYAQIRLSSGELRLVRQECMATVGAVSNPDNSNQNIGKAGRNRLKGIRPQRARRGDEPDRPPARRRRGPHLRRPAPGDAVGQADQGRAHAQEQGDGQVHPALAPPEEERSGKEPDHVTFSLEGPLRRRLRPEEGGEARASRAATR